MLTANDAEATATSFDLGPNPVLAGPVARGEVGQIWKLITALQEAFVAGRLERDRAEPHRRQARRLRHRTEHHPVPGRQTTPGPHRQGHPRRTRRRDQTEGGPVSFTAAEIEFLASQPLAVSQPPTPPASPTSSRWPLSSTGPTFGSVVRATHFCQPGKCATSPPAPAVSRWSSTTWSRSNRSLRVGSVSTA